MKLYSATESKTVRFHERHAPDGAAIAHRRVCVKEDREVPYSEVVKGFEVRPGRYVALSNEEIAAADGPAAHVIDIEHFVHREEIDPVYYDDRAYYLGPDKLGEDAYRLLHAAMKRSDRVGIGRFVFHNRSRLLALRALDKLIAVHMMRFADELILVRELNIPSPTRKPSKPEMEAARTLVDHLAGRFQPHLYHDAYRQAVMELIERKAGGEAVKAPEPVPVTAEDELLAALQQSLQTRRRTRRTRGHSH